MLQHNGMRPQDIAVLLKIMTSPPGWMNKQLAEALLLSPAEVTYSLRRSAAAGLLDFSRKNVMQQPFLDFIKYGLPYVFPAVKGAVGLGVPTAYAAPVMSGQVAAATDKIVWPHLEGNAKGESIQPLYPNVVKAALKDQKLYDLLALVDVMRVGKVREKDAAMKLLREQLQLPYA